MQPENKTSAAAIPTTPPTAFGSIGLQTALAVSLILLLVLSLWIGWVPIAPDELGPIVRAWVGNDTGQTIAGKALVLGLVRIPRSLATVLVGMGLSAAGVVYQGLFRNPLVSPDILGVSAGATFGAALGLLMAGSSWLTIQALAFGCGLVAVGSALLIARIVAVRPMLVLVLAGLVVMSVFNAAITLLKYLSDPYNELPAIVFWIMGSMSRVQWGDLKLAAPVIGGSLVLIHVMRYKLNVLSLGDLQASSLGLNPRRDRLIFIFLSSITVSVSVAVCGQVLWVGLVMPHIARTLVGPNHEQMLPVAVLSGGIFLLLADTAARCLTMAELPISVVTAFTGAPLFAYLLYRNRGSGWS
ncbi:iron ABC transporter permease [Desulfosarcina ovata subsp. sediminis]|uniref:Iron ABC transporter permease n=1 Tax=Desulfosarcina ovata subsp. sediminis TaxID=885957 RepID=A0A5K7ZQN2_9BACT|nr:iron ABC transporter permease [Desulfosarcina ovata]BBO82090.1 iron ABC transporter permease [Desulfosarcina ovata subsp. sediminis]